MHRVFGFLTKRDGLSMPEFKDYYENHHVPLLLSRAPKPLIHKRRYVNTDIPNCSRCLARFHLS
jgi:hypothetical protein